MSTIKRPNSSRVLDGAPYDPRRVANLLLGEARRIGLSISNLSLQKLLYFSHGFALIQHQIPLVSGYFEAWHYGPVHPAVYEAFKSAQANPITFKAQACDVLTGKSIALSDIDATDVRRLAQKVLAGYGDLSPGQLVNIVHAKRGPWDFIVEKAAHSIVLGMQIPNDIIAERFRYHLISVADKSSTGEPREDEPFTQNRPGADYGHAARGTRSSPEGISQE